MGRTTRSGYTVVDADDVVEERQREGQSDRSYVDEESPLTGSAAESIYVEAEKPATRLRCSVLYGGCRCGNRGWGLSASMSLAGIWVGMTMIAHSYPAPHFYRPEGFTAVDVLDKPGLFLPPYGGWTSGIDVEGKSSLENTRHVESGLERPNGRRWVDNFAFYHSSTLATAGCAAVALSTAILTFAGKQLTDLREQLVLRRLQRVPKQRCIPVWLVKYWPTWTYSEWLCNSLLVSTCIYWTIPHLRCRNCWSRSRTI